jgi:preprotein translocase subunit SecB
VKGKFDDFMGHLLVHTVKNMIAPYYRACRIARKAERGSQPAIFIKNSLFSSMFRFFADFQENLKEGHYLR